jgi:hypothetical protein
MNRLGEKSYFDPDIQSVYFCRETLAGLLRQGWANGWSSVYLPLSGIYGFGLRHYVPMIFVAAIVLLGVVSPFDSTMSHAFSAVVVLYSVVAVAVSMLATAERRLGLAATLLPFWFALLHVTYGTASWAGLYAWIGERIGLRCRRADNLRGR